MVDQIGNQSFFPDTKSTAQKAKLDASAKAESFENVLSSQSDDKTTKAQKYKMDKPKVGNKEPFFPEKAMPYHPEEKVERNEINKVQTTRSSKQVEEVAEKDSNEDDQNVVVLPPMEGMDIEKFLKAYQASQGENTSDLMSQSYENSTVNYPVSQIASQSLDEETKKMLMEQGLWNMQANYVAQPSPKLLTMMEVVNSQSEVQVTKPVAQFMASMQSELGVQPDRLAQAMLNLPEGQFSQPPEDTMKQVIANLDLNKKDEQIATQLYSKMLKDMQSLDESKAMQADLLPLPLEAKLNQQQNINALNLASQDKLMIQNQMQKNNQGFEQNFNQQSMNQQNTNMLKEQNMNAEKLNTQLEVKHLDVRSDLNIQHQNHLSKFDPMTTMSGGIGVNQLATNDGLSSKQEAIQSIINNAQALSHKGGGEMKLTLRPDHLGEIQLKVTMNGSNVDIQMVAEKSETKKLIEQNISELKHGLSQHNLSMEKLDVSVADKNVGNFNQGREHNFHQAKEFAQAFSQQQQTRKQNELNTVNPSFKHRSMLKSSSMSDLSMKRAGSSSGRLNVVA